MRLKRLELIGFKSFADKTKLEFNDGITAVVGPNGCGKSNIADAFRWVMGEQSAKSMRGTKMPDVIFAGTTQRKALNFAEVTITLTDIEGMLPVIYEEVAITRRLHRSGDSEYFINRHPVRLKDIQSLLLDTGLGKDAYSIFEQGEIDRVINLPPLERRYIFEEAAGILRFLQRKKEALRKLEHTDLNVTRIRDIHKEVEKQIIVLEQQAEKAREYKDNKALLDYLEKAFLLTKWEAMQVRLKESLHKTHSIDLNIAEANSAIDAFQGKLQDAKQSLNEAEKILQERREEVFKARSSKEIRWKEKQNQEERLKELIAKEKRWLQELAAMQERRLHRQEERRKVQHQQKDLEQQRLEREKQVQRQSEVVRQSENELGTAREQQQLKQRESFKQLQAEAQCESEVKQVSLRLENTQERHQQILERKKRLLHSMQELNASGEEKKSLLEEKIKGVEGQKSIIEAIDKELLELSEEHFKTQAEIDRFQHEIAEAKARQKALQSLRDEMEGFSAGSKAVLQESADLKSPLYGKVKGLYEYFVAEKGVEDALAAVMKSYAQTLAVATESDFALVIQYIKKHGLKDISLICLESLAKVKASKSSSSMPKQLSLLAVHFIENELTKHFLKDVYLANESGSPAEILKQHAGLEICLPEGIFIDRRMVVFYSSQGENNIFMREAELKTLAKRLKASEASRQQWESVLNALQQKRQKLQTEKIELDKTIRRGEMQLVEVNFALQKISADLEKIKTEDKQLVQESAALNHSINELTARLHALKQHLSQAKETAAHAQKSSEAFNLQLNSLAVNAKQQANDLRDKETALKHVLDEVSKHTHALHVMDVKDLESQQQEKRLEEEIEMGRTQQLQISHKGIEVNKLLQEVEHTLSDVTTACKDLEQQVGIRKKTLEQLDSKIHEKRHLLKKLENERQQSCILNAQIESQKQTVENELKERHHLAIEEARTHCGTIDKTADQLDKQIRSLRQYMEAAGDINMTSIEECDKHKVRYTFLNQQIDDLNITRQELVSIITQLDSESRKIFKDTFEKINANFKKNFQILFNGGEADLQFTETADVLEAGIDIIAKPPGKQMRSINLLSGGEKCLTAMALLFAIFEVRPAPFCILDEIDAPLDDTNVERFVNIVKEFSDRCQFIIITHNKCTMAVADILFGISMEEKGVSKLLTLDMVEVG